MNAADSVIAARSGARRAAWYLVLVAAGLAGNYFKYPIFLNIDFLFGSIFAMLALQLFGTGRGIVAAILIAAVTYLHWNDPYAILIMTVEAATVGWVINRYRIGLVLADALYWLILGMPLVYLFYHIVMGVPVGNTTIAMTKQAVNGIANALIARLVFTALVLSSRNALIAYRDLIYNLLAFFALCPSLVLMGIASRVDFTETDQSIRAELLRNSRSISNRLDIWVQDRVPALVSLAGLAATLNSQEMQARLEQARAADGNFLRVGLLDKSATIVAQAPSIDELGQSSIGRNFADRPYIDRLKATLKPVLSEVVMGRIGTPGPIVALHVPVVSRGEYAGYASGVLRLDQLRDFLETSAANGSMLYTLLDRNGNIILSNRKDQKIMSPLVRGEGKLNRLDDAISQWVPPQTTPSEQWRSSFYVSQTRVGNLAGWNLILEQPVAPFQKRLFKRYTDALAVVLVLLFAALALAEILSRKLAATTERLSELTQYLPSTLELGGDTEWPESAVLEPHNLIGHFREMTQKLSAQFSANRRLNVGLEQKVAERTKALEMKMTELKRSNADLEQFAYAASHDMRQPLRMISSYLQLLEAELEPMLNGDTRQNLQFATEGAQRMDQMLGALLDYSRIGRSGGTMVLVDSREVAAEALRYLGPAITHSGAQVRIDGDWPQILASRDEILRLLQNLIDNALKYRLEGRKAEIVVSSRAVEGEWRVTVKDNGIGLLPGQEARLFKVFERLQPRSRYPGTGIGLALCRKIVEHHNGSIGVESTGENQGCRFFFTMPVLVDMRGFMEGAASQDETGIAGAKGENA